MKKILLAATPTN